MFLGGRGCVHRGIFTLFVKYSPPPSPPGPLIQTVKKLSFQAQESKAARKRPRAGGHNRPPFLGVRLGILVRLLLPFSPSSSFHPKLQSSGVQDQPLKFERPWGGEPGWVMREQGPQALAPQPHPWKKGESCLTSSGEPAQPALALGFSSFYLTSPPSSLVALPLGGCAGNAEQSDPARLPPHPQPCLMCAQMCIPTLPSCSLPGSP